jgi:bifunctional ADP-heptose synthase (sugar kinase/adenylyltransferase)
MLLRDAIRNALEAMRLANRAAGVAVGRFGTAVASADEVFGEAA